MKPGDQQHSQATWRKISHQGLGDFRVRAFKDHFVSIALQENEDRRGFESKIQTNSKTHISPKP